MENKNDKFVGFGVIGFLLLAACFGAFYQNHLIDLDLLDLKYENLEVLEDRLTATPYFKVREPCGAKSGCESPSILVPLESNIRNIRDVCVIWESICSGFHEIFLPPEIASLRAGDRVKIWLKRDRNQIFQLSHNDKIILSYQDSLRIFQKEKDKNLVVAILGGLSGLAIFIFIFLKFKKIQKQNDHN